MSCRCVFSLDPTSCQVRLLTVINTMVADSERINATFDINKIFHLIYRTVSTFIGIPLYYTNKSERITN